MIAVLVILLLATIIASILIGRNFWKIHISEIEKLRAFYQKHLTENDEANSLKIKELSEAFEKEKKELKKELSSWFKLPGIRKEKLYKDLPFEEGKTYITKYQTRAKYTVLKIRVDKNGKQVIDREGRQTIDLGYAEEYKDRDFRYGISAERLHADKEEIGERWVCGHCSHPLEEKSTKKYFNI